MTLIRNSPYAALYKYDDGFTVEVFNGHHTVRTRYGVDQLSNALAWYNQTNVSASLSLGFLWSKGQAIVTGSCGNLSDYHNVKSVLLDGVTTYDDWMEAMLKDVSEPYLNVALSRSAVIRDLQYTEWQIDTYEAVENSSDYVVHLRNRATKVRLAVDVTYSAEQGYSSQLRMPTTALMFDGTDTFTTRMPEHIHNTKSVIDQWLVDNIFPSPLSELD